MSEVTIDFVARDQAHGGCALVLVEAGPWTASDIAGDLRRIQDRLYGCLDAALEGFVAEQFPESVGKPLMIRLDAYDAPETELADFFARFASAVPKLPDYAQALAAPRHHPAIAFEVNMSRLPDAV